MMRLVRITRMGQVLLVLLLLQAVIATTGATMVGRAGHRHPVLPPVTAALAHPAAPFAPEEPKIVLADVFVQGPTRDADSLRNGAAPPQGQGWALQDAAQQVDATPASFSWALIIGINDYAGGTRDNIGSYQDAVSLRSYLLSLGWRDDHIRFVANRDATRPNVIAGIRWLASKTDNRSVAIVHYAGHEKPVHRDLDGDGDSLEPQLWLSDNRLLSNVDFGKEMNAVRAKRMWIQMAVCRAGGFDTAGMIKPGRVLTFSSPASELSYEDPDVHHSVFGYFMLVQGIVQGDADLNGDGFASVEEGFVYGKPRTLNRTLDNQHPLMIDKLAGDFDLRIATA